MKKWVMEVNKIKNSTTYGVFGKREIEFRAWSKSYKEIVKVDLLGKNKVLSSRTWFDFNDIELMQYTGLKDKNGVKIFEGDIVKFDNKLYKVIWDSDECRFGLTNNVENTLVLLTSWRMQKLEVIGNIYENKELMTHSC